MRAPTANCRSHDCKSVCKATLGQCLAVAVSPFADVLVARSTIDSITSSFPESKPIRPLCVFRKLHIDQAEEIPRLANPSLPVKAHASITILMRCRASAQKYLLSCKQIVQTTVAKYDNNSSLVSKERERDELRRKVRLTAERHH